MPLCPNQHESRTTDFCEVCGVEMPSAAADDAPATGSAGGREVCPACHAEHDPGGGVFCEVCGYNFKTGVQSAVMPSKAGPSPAKANVPALVPTSLLPRWELIVAVAPNPHVGMPDGASPPAFGEQVWPLAADVFLIGRRSARRQIDPDLSLDQDDSSHRHARLTRLPGEDFSLEDLGSSNGTVVNGVEVKPGVAVTLKEGDRITLGRWTSLTVRREDPPADGLVLPPSPPAA